MSLPIACPFVFLACIDGRLPYAFRFRNVAVPFDFSVVFFSDSNGWFMRAITHDRRYESIKRMNAALCRKFLVRHREREIIQCPHPRTIHQWRQSDRTATRVAGPRRMSPLLLDRFWFSLRHSPFTLVHCRVTGSPSIVHLDWFSREYP